MIAQTGASGAGTGGGKQTFIFVGVELQGHYSLLRLLCNQSPDSGHAFPLTSSPHQTRPHPRPHEGPPVRVHHLGEGSVVGLLRPVRGRCGLQWGLHRCQAELIPWASRCVCTVVIERCRERRAVVVCVGGGGGATELESVT